MVCVSASEARSIAQERFRMIQTEPDQMVYPWRQASVGVPTLVRTVMLKPSYWIVPVNWKEKVIGYINVEMNGVVSAYGYFYRHPQNLENCPSTVTWFSSTKAMRHAENILQQYKEASISQPVFVHDGAKSKRAWMITIMKNDKLLSRVFVTPNLVYERKGDQPILRKDIE